jgi:hypothetical protein
MVKELRDWVKLKLTMYPKLRDSNERLYYNYLSDLGYNMDTSIKKFLKDMECRNIPYIDSFGRASRKVQEEHPHLRGKLWGKRKKKMKDVKQEIKTM